MTNLEWASQWRAEMLHVLKDLRSGEGALTDLLPFIEAACRRSKIGAEIKDGEKRKKYVTKNASRILAYDVAKLIKESRSVQISNYEPFWSEFITAVFYGVERVVVDHEHPLTYRPDVPIEGLRAKVPSVEEAYEREQEELQPLLSEKAWQKVAASMPRLYTTINERMLVAPLPIYSLMKRHPDRYGFLWGLYVVLWPRVELFEALVKAYAGAEVKVPVKADYEKAERLRKILHLRSTGLTQEKIATRLDMTQERVNQLLKESRRPEMQMERAMLKALSKALKCLMKASAADAIRAL